MEYLKRGELLDAVTSMMSDMDKHPETVVKSQTLINLGMLTAMNATKGDRAAVERYILGFN
jgi:hypothetical protein